MRYFDNQIQKIIKRKSIDQMLEYLYERHEFFDLILVYVFLCQILKVGPLTSHNIKKKNYDNRKTTNKHLDSISQKHN